MLKGRDYKLFMQGNVNHNRKFRAGFGEDLNFNAFFCSRGNNGVRLLRFGITRKNMSGKPLLISFCEHIKAFKRKITQIKSFY
jgi:hypothetical protein